MSSEKALFRRVIEQDKDSGLLRNLLATVPVATNRGPPEGFGSGGNVAQSVSGGCWAVVCFRAMVVKSFQIHSQSCRVNVI
jgi:hypothetical protein